MPDSSANTKADGTWSPDGSSIAFYGGSSASVPAIYIIDLKTHLISTLSDSQGLYSPRWSPDGRFLVAMPLNALSLRLYDFKLHKWSQLVSVNTGHTGYPCWSANSKYVYFLARQKDPAILRVSIPDGKLEQVASLKGVPVTGYWGQWLGLAPDDSLLILKDAGTQEIVSMDFHEP